MQYYTPDYTMAIIYHFGIKWYVYMYFFGQRADAHAGPGLRAGGAGCERSGLRQGATARVMNHCVVM